MKYVVVTGGVVSGLGKGISSSSIGVLLKEVGLHVTSIKIDPYLNIDAGTMSPYEHGEVYVLEDGGEVDLDLGNYERFLATRLTRDHNITTGKVYNEVLANERRGDYLGKTVQVVPHVTNCIQDWIHRAAHHPIDSTMPAYSDENGKNEHDFKQHNHSKRGKRPDVCMIEVGGTVGDIESMVFLEAIRQFKYRIGEDNLCHVHVSLVPVVGAVGEPKSKPTQHSVKELRAAGLSPDLILCRSTQPLEREVIAKISLFCMVPPSHVISVHDVSNIYKVPGLLHDQRVTSIVLNKLKINRMTPIDLPLYQFLAERNDNPAQSVKIALVGKYTGLSDSYLSITKALSHAGIHNNVKIDLLWVDSERLQDDYKSRSQSTSLNNIKQTHDYVAEYDEAWSMVRAASGILVPGGFGDRGVAGKILAINYARTNNVPFFGICLGFQMAVIEYARSVCGISNASSEEFDPDNTDNVIVFMPEVDQKHMGGTMRLGGRHSDIQPGTLAHQIYDGRLRIFERHRHRYEVNPRMIELLQDMKYNSGAGTGMIFSGKDSETGNRMECMELMSDNHKYYFGCQYHPEFTSRPSHPNPIFYTFVQAAMGEFQHKKINNHISASRVRSTLSLANMSRSTSKQSLSCDKSYHVPPVESSPSPTSDQRTPTSTNSNNNSSVSPVNYEITNIEQITGHKNTPSKSGNVLNQVNKLNGVSG